MVTLHMKDARDYLARRVAELHADLRLKDVNGLAQTVGAVVVDGRFHLHIWGQPITLSPPNFTALDANEQELDTFTQAMLAYYLHTSNGAPLAGEWIAFTELPDGQFYTAAFQGYTGNELAKVFGNEVERFAETAVALGGQPLQFADRAFAFRVLPHVAIMAAAWQGDEDFPPSYRLLFDANTAHHLPTDACAIIGSTLTRKLVKATQQGETNQT
ncbi:MAG: DUF3786 domain-containing protein [Anaerolineales bacterium]|nr:DUF3786 domain-containing protein [Anaerolineales bacterium]MCB8990434.1 DUF3786 domain-containing protein [Ardenticatenaceae bacterium]MCB9003448.1 DUF3786 domain-containing protein [Ardenticatenaceae bacterium]